MDQASSIAALCDITLLSGDDSLTLPLLSIGGRAHRLHDLGGQSLRRFDLIWLMTQGGPIGATNTLVIELYRRAFVYRDLGQAAAVGMIGLSIAIIITLVYFRLTLRAERAKGQR